MYHFNHGSDLNILGPRIICSLHQMLFGQVGNFCLKERIIRNSMRNRPMILYLYVKNTYRFDDSEKRDLQCILAYSCRLGCD